MNVDLIKGGLFLCAIEAAVFCASDGRWLGAVLAGVIAVGSGVVILRRPPTGGR